MSFFDREILFHEIFIPMVITSLIYPVIVENCIGALL